MPSQILPLLQNELTKATRRRLPYFGLFAVGLACIITYFIAGGLSEAAAANAWGYLGFSMQLVFSDIGPVFVVVFSAMLVAEETGTGTIRAALSAPLQRWELYVAKAVAGLIYTFALSAAALLFSVLLASIHHHFGPVSDSMGVIYSRDKALQQLALAFALSWLPLAALVMYAVLISTLVRTPGTAVAVGISAMFIVDFAKHLVGLDPYIFTRHTNFPWMTLQQLAQGLDFQWFPEAGNLILLSGTSAAVFFAAGLIIFVRQDLNH